MLKPARHCGPTHGWAGHQFSPSGEELARWASQLDSGMKWKDKTISELRGTVDELADTVAKRERHVQRHQTKSEDQAGWHKVEWERLCARIAALEAKLVVLGGHLSNRSQDCLLYQATSNSKTRRP